MVRRPFVRSTVVGFPDDSSPAYNCRMAASRINEPIEPMTLGNMRANGVRSARRVLLAMPSPGDLERRPVVR
jgi:hypothetical protein